jgi:hypothetical protein
MGNHLNAVHFLQAFAGLRDHAFADVGQPKMVLASLNQSDTQFLLKILQSNAERGLRHIAALSCTTEIHVVGKCHQVL